nr:hypothetical protein [Tanacetum cinerariifolium]
MPWPSVPFYHEFKVKDREEDPKRCAMALATAMVTVAEVTTKFFRDLLRPQVAVSLVMDAPTLFVSTKKNLGDPIETRVDIVHPAPVDVFPATTVMRTLAQHEEDIRGIHGHLQGVLINKEMNALRFRMGMAEEENASLRGKIKTIEAIDIITHRREKRARMELER